MTKEFHQAGGEIVSSIETVKNQDVFQPVVARLTTAAPDVTFLFLYARDAGICIKEAARQGIQTAFVGTDNFTGSELPEAAGSAIEGVMYAVPKSGAPTAKAAVLRSMYQRKFGAGKEPSLFTVQGYDVIHVLAKAIDATNADVDASIAYLEKLKHDGAGGAIAFNAEHELANTSYQLLVFRRTPTGVVAGPLERK